MRFCCVYRDVIEKETGHVHSLETQASSSGNRDIGDMGDSWEGQMAPSGKVCLAVVSVRLLPDES